MLVVNYHIIRRVLNWFPSLLNSAIFLTQMEIEILIFKPFLENQIGTHIYFIRFGSHYCHSRGSFYVAGRTYSYGVCNLVLRHERISAEA